jgi:hypothetical protein
MPLINVDMTEVQAEQILKAAMLSEDITKRDLIYQLGEQPDITLRQALIASFILRSLEEYVTEIEECRKACLPEIETCKRHRQKKRTKKQKAV